MYMGRDIIGRPVVSYDMGQKIGVVKDLIFDQNNDRLLGFLLSEPSLFNSADVLLLKDVQAIGPDAVITASKDAIGKANQIPTINDILKHNNILKGTRILTLDGRDLGTMVDLYFDEWSGDIEGYEVSGGLFADAYSGRSFVPAPQTLKIGQDVAFVPRETADLMEEQVGGIKAAMQVAGEKTQEAAQVTGEKLQEFGQVASEKAQEAAQVTGEKLQELQQFASEKAEVASEKLQEMSRSATTSITNTIVSPEEQKEFVIGKAVDSDIIAPGGQALILQGQIVTPGIANSAEYLEVLDQLYRATGGNLPAKLGEKATNAVASVTVEQAQGRRIRYFVRSDEGSIIGAPGQIVTPQVIERAKLNHKEQALLEAVGLSTTEALQNKAGNAVVSSKERLKSTAQTTGEQLQSSAAKLWVQVKSTANELQDRGAQALEEQRIKGALGRAVTRVILDQYDQVILNVGELITHAAVDRARQAQVLDILLDSVYTEKPLLTLEDLQAPRAGQAAL